MSWQRLGAENHGSPAAGRDAHAFYTVASFMVCADLFLEEGFWIHFWVLRFLAL